MAVHYSTQFATAADQNTLVDPPLIVHTGFTNGRVRYKPMHILTDQVFAITEVIRMGTFKSNARIYTLELSCPDLGTAGDFDIGLHLTGGAHDGAEVDENLFADGLDVNTTASVRVEAFTNAALTLADRGKTLWELLGLSVDPVVNYDMTITAVEATTSTSADVLLEAWYNAGD